MSTDKPIVFNDRQKNIGKLLDANGTVFIKDLIKLYPDISEMTVRRDLDYFESLGLVDRVRGGAVKKLKAYVSDVEAVYGQRLLRARAAKEAISRAAIPYAQGGRSLFFDSGTTIMMLIREIDFLKVAVITSGVNIAAELIKKQDVSVNVLGGHISPHNLSVSGKTALDMLSDINIDTAFLVCSAFTPEHGFSCGVMAECELKRMVVAKAGTKILLADSTKTGFNMPFTFAGFKDIDILITDEGIDEKYVAALEDMGKKVVIAGRKTDN